MTAAGIALIAGGLAILIGFRHVFWGGRGGRRRMRTPRAIEAARRPAIGAAPHDPPTRAAGRPVGAEVAPTGVPGPRRRHVPVVAAPNDGQAPGARTVEAHMIAAAVHERDSDLDEIRPVRPPAGGLARIGLADDDGELSGDVFEVAPDLVEDMVDADRPDDDTEEQSEALTERHADQIEPVEAPVRRERYGDRIDGWVRPRYEPEPESGEYWTPIPESSYADAGYGWPVPVERLPAVPMYPPRSGFGVEPLEEAEPTAVVPQWPPVKPSGRIELPRSWAVRNTRDPDPVERGRAGQDDTPSGRSAVMIRRRRASGITETLPAVAGATDMLPEVDDSESEPPRRRPRPRPSHPEVRSTVYRSRHAADPG